MRVRSVCAALLGRCLLFLFVGERGSAEATREDEDEGGRSGDQTKTRVSVTAHSREESERGSPNHSRGTAVAGTLENHSRTPKEHNNAGRVCIIRCERQTYATSEDAQTRTLSEGIESSPVQRLKRKKRTVVYAESREELYKSARACALVAIASI